jgi:glycosyltransferase involved in cell wall biosynthesis
MRWYFLGQALKAHGIEVEIASASYFHKYISPPTVRSALQTETIDGLVYHWLRTRAYKRRGVGQVFNQLQFVAQLFRFAGQLAARKPDVVVASAPHPLVIFPAARIAEKAGARLVYEVRDLWPELLCQLGNFSRAHPYVLLNGMAERYAVRHADLIVSVKPGDPEYFAGKYGVASERCAYIPNGFLPGTSAGEPPAELMRLRQNYKYLVGYVGAVSRYYGLEELVHLAAAVRDNDDIGFVVFGGGDKAADIRALAERYGLANFHMLGTIPRGQVDAALAQFDVCYAGLQDLDLHRYGISCNKIYEYMHSAKPILACYSAGYDPVREAGCGLTVAPGDSARLAEALTTLLEDTGGRAEMGARGRRYFDDQHDFSAISGIVSERFGKLLRTT